MDGKQAAEQEKINMRAMSNPVYFKFTGFVGEVKGNKIVTVMNGDVPQKVDAGRVLLLGFLGTQYQFKAGDEMLVPKAASQAWEQQNLHTWQDKVVFEVREAKMVVADDVVAAAKVRAEIEADLHKKYQEQIEAMQKKHDAELAQATEPAKKK